MSRIYELTIYFYLLNERNKESKHIRTPQTNENQLVEQEF